MITEKSTKATKLPSVGGFYVGQQNARPKVLQNPSFTNQTLQSISCVDPATFINIYDLIPQRRRILSQKEQFLPRLKTEQSPTQQVRLKSRQRYQKNYQQTIHENEFLDIGSPVVKRAGFNNFVKVINQQNGVISQSGLSDDRKNVVRIRIFGSSKTTVE